PTMDFGRTPEIYDTTIGSRFVNPKFKAQFGVDSMPETAQNVAEKCQISHADQDLFAYRSQQKTAVAQQEGIFAEEILPLEVKGPKKTLLTSSQDEHPRAESTMDKLDALNTTFRKEGGAVTAGNASGVHDDAACVLLGNQQFSGQYGLRPQA